MAWAVGLDYNEVNGTKGGKDLLFSIFNISHSGLGLGIGREGSRDEGRCPKFPERTTMTFPI